MPDTSFLVASLSVVGALAAGLTTLPRPKVALGILFLVASFSRATLETPLGTMRPEMPAIAVVAVVLLVGGRFRGLRGLPRTTWAIAIAFGAFLFALALSSVFVAPETGQSVRMVAWFATSMLGGVCAFMLALPRPLDSIEPFAFSGAVMGVLGIAVALVFLLTGPTPDLGIQEAFTEVPRVYALGWESNLYASFLGMCTFFALEMSRGRSRRAGFLLLAAILIGFALGLTRGAYLGLAAGILAYGLARFVAERRLGDLPRLGAATAGSLVVGLMAATVMLPNVLERHGTESSEPPSASVEPSRPAGTSVSSPGSPDNRPPPPTPEATLVPLSDTVAFRLERLPIALAEIPQSPLVGFGAESFGQRHPDRYAGPGPDHIAVMAVVVPYESGLIGATAIVLGFGLLLIALWRTMRRAAAVGDPIQVGAAAAFLGSLVSVLVAYQVTNSLHMAINWIVIGAAAALTAQPDPTHSVPAAAASFDASNILT
jgi:hypothetical protein